MLDTAYLLELFIDCYYTFGTQMAIDVAYDLYGMEGEYYIKWLCS